MAGKSSAKLKSKLVFILFVFLAVRIAMLPGAAEG